MRTPNNERLTHDIDEGSASRANGSERRCILSGKSFPREDLLRLAIAPPDADGISLVLPDPGAKAPGRGAWIAPDRGALERALAEGHLKKALLRAFRGAKLTIPEDLADRIEAALARSLADRLGLELRAGHVVLGSARIEEQARSGRIALLFHARDSSEDGRKRLDQAWRVGSDAEGSGLRGEVLPLDRAALSVALGRDNVVHLGISHPRGQEAGGSSPASRVAHAAARLSNYMAGAAGQSGTRQMAADTAGAPGAGVDDFAKD
ncbi:DUF448 domain-containing protein [Erythrobacter sp. HL-111]|uniref:DUF448 domain-containing protein n=1 Tax=Erythrobacter sp. HL-111 TaxID=1798193 RepID=UPI0006DB6F3B|nr:DUF448 domain-containing protein [Erythrobacter sp. HL-111]KPP88585.1 MAG: hypothetical protein HLUCCO15_11205 [Erythrobacteraceae bacterium HL-111]SDS30201.1 hypothetical protein SAMN04515621_1320 [Erythrobacter sp. HL-111]